jgi:hypothetical protein
VDTAKYHRDILYGGEYFKHRLGKSIPSFPFNKKNFWSSCLQKGFFRTDKVKSIAYFVKDNGTDNEDNVLVGRIDRLLEQYAYNQKAAAESSNITLTTVTNEVPARNNVVAIVCIVLVCALIILIPAGCCFYQKWRMSRGTARMAYNLHVDDDVLVQ